jgi:predicted metalloprotease
MRWDRNYQSNNVEDRRGQGGFGGFGGGGGLPLGGLMNIFGMFGIKGILIGLLLLAVLGGGTCVGVGGGLDSCAGGGSPSGQQASNPPANSSPQEDELVHFVGFVFDDVQKMWRENLKGYQNAKMVLFRDGINSACGTASTAVGPFYCPLDNKVYIDLAFYDELRAKFGAPGDFAQAYVIAHEVGHHVQNLTNRIGRRGDRDQIQVELQADCLAGAWGKDAERRGLLEIGDVDEALHAASAIGDDTLQRKTQGRVQPETWTHGSSAQRTASFRKGYEGGPQACGL